MSNRDRNVVGVTVTLEAVDHHGRPGPWVKASKTFDDGDVDVDWYPPAWALWLADELRRAAS